MQYQAFPPNYQYGPSRASCPVTPVYSRPTYFQRYPIAEKDRAQYENLFGLILSIEMIEEEYTSGELEKDTHDKLMKDLLLQFETVRNALDLSTDQLAHFCVASHIPHSFFIAAVRGGTADSSTDGSSLADATQLGTELTTLSDQCFMRTSPASEYIALLRIIAGRMTSLNIFAQSPEAKEYADKWIREFGALRPSEMPSDEMLERLKSDLLVWRHVALGALR